MAEEWRVTIALDDAPGADGSTGARSMTPREVRKRDRARDRRMRDVAWELRDRLDGAAMEPDVPSRSRFRLLERLDVRLGLLDCSSVRVYMDSREDAEAGGQIGHEVAGARGLAADVTVECWHPREERWDAAPISQDDLAEEERVSHEHEQQRQRRRSAETGIAQWQVRAELGTHDGTVALAQRLSAEGHSIDRGWKFVVAGADSEDDAHRLADKIRMYTAADAKIHVRPNIPVSPVIGWPGPFPS